MLQDIASQMENRHENKHTRKVSNSMRWLYNLSDLDPYIYVDRLLTLLSCSPKTKMAPQT